MYVYHKDHCSQLGIMCLATYEPANYNMQRWFSVVNGTQNNRRKGKDDSILMQIWISHHFWVWVHKVPVRWSVYLYLAFMLEYVCCYFVYIYTCLVHIWWAGFLEVVSLSIKGDVFQFHVDVAVLLIERPADGSAVERRPTANVILQHRHWLWLLIGHLDLWGLKSDKTRGLLKSSKG